MNLRNNRFVIRDSKVISSVNAEVFKIVHAETGLNILYAKNDDDNKVFYAAFRTPPKDNSGVAHILEHSVLCGSEKYKAKDLFNELTKGSINTYLNAMTFSDKTMYPVASQNSKDFFNLMEVYLDSVFNPMICEEPRFFAQEGWSYRVNESGEIDLNGIVYNEMKGANASPERILIKKIDEALFAGTPYEYDSGGLPYSIPDLSYEQLLRFYESCYTPSNCLIYLYGDLDIDIALEMIEASIKAFIGCVQKKPVINFDSGEKISSDEKTGFYSVNEEKTNGALYAVSYAASNYLDFETTMALEILNYILAGHDAAPLRAALSKSGLCGDFYSYYRTSAYKTSFSFVGKDAAADVFDEYKALVKTSLKDLYENGIDTKLIEGALNKWEFYISEEDYGNRPKGLFYGIAAASAWVYGGDVFDELSFKNTFKRIKEKSKSGLFEQLLKKYLVNNDQIVYTKLLPKLNLNDELESEQKARLQNLKESMTGREFEELKKKSDALDEFRKSPTPQSVINKIPKLDVSDLGKNIKRFEYENENRNIFMHNDKENIEYINLHFSLEQLPTKLIPYCGFLSRVLGKLPTKSYTAEQFINEMNIYAGSIGYSADSLQRRDGTYIPRFNVKIRCLTKNVDRVLELINEALCPVFDEAKIKQIAEETLVRLESGFASNGHSIASQRALSYMFPSANFTDLISGIGFYHELFNKKPEELIANLKRLIKIVFNHDNLFIGISASQKDNSVVKKVKAFSDGLSNADGALQQAEPLCNTSINEGFIFDGGVCFNAAAHKLYDMFTTYNGSLQVAKSIINLEYLWHEIRNKGGAYGCGSSFSRNGTVFFFSYRDPELKKTYDVYDSSFEFLSKYSSHDLSKYIINAIKPFERPLSSEEALDTVMSNHLLDVSNEMRQAERDEILAATLSDINEAGNRMKDFKGKSMFCTIGNSQKINAENIFMKKSNLRLTR